MRIWNSKESKATQIYQPNNRKMVAVAWSYQGNYLAFGGEDNLVHIWSISNAETRYNCSAHDAKINSVAWSHRGYRLASASKDQTMRIWNLETFLS